MHTKALTLLKKCLSYIFCNLFIFSSLSLPLYGYALSPAVCVFAYALACFAWIGCYCMHSPLWSYWCHRIIHILKLGTLIESDSSIECYISHLNVLSKASLSASRLFKSDTMSWVIAGFVAVIVAAEADDDDASNGAFPAFISDWYEPLPDCYQPTQLD